jgi:hypothetical protein
MAASSRLRGLRMPSKGTMQDWMVVRCASMKTTNGETPPKAQHGLQLSSRLPWLHQVIHFHSMAFKMESLLGIKVEQGPSARTHPSHSRRLGRVGGLLRMRDNFHPPVPLAENMSKDRETDTDTQNPCRCRCRCWCCWLGSPGAGVWHTMKARGCPFVGPSPFSQLVSWFLSKPTPDGLLSLAVANVCLRPFVVCFAPTSRSFSPPGHPRPVTPFSCTPRHTLYC